jgi:hypothetical protein
VFFYARGSGYCRWEKVFGFKKPKRRRLMNAKFTLIMTCLGISAALFIPEIASGTITTGSWYMDQSDIFADGVNYGQVDILADTADGTVKFTVDAFDVQPTYGTLSNFGIQLFGFNYSNDVLASSSTWSVDLPAHWDQSAGQIDGFGMFQVTEDTTGGFRKDPLVFTIHLPVNHFEEAVAGYFAIPSTGSVEGEVYFAAHIAGFSNLTADSHKVGGSTSVPEPITLSLLVFGGLALLRKKS